MPRTNVWPRSRGLVVSQIAATRKYAPQSYGWDCQYCLARSLPRGRGVPERGLYSALRNERQPGPDIRGRTRAEFDRLVIRAVKRAEARAPERAIHGASRYERQLGAEFSVVADGELEPLKNA